ncbi:MAG: MFS transporter, partial [Spirochaetes bacterium]|nr:MFS transporter [Spirochaetota bacterium]
MQNKANPLNQFLRTFYTYKFFTDFAFIYAVYVVLFKVRGLSIFQISLLLALWCGFVILLEVPTGALSDRWNRKWMLFLGMLAKVMAFTIWFFSHKFLFYALGFLLWGIQEAFASGTEEALLYDTLNKYGKTEDYEKIAGKSQFYSKIAVGTSVLLGGIIASYSLDLNIILSIISMLIAMITTLFFHEIEDAKLHVKRTTYKEMIKNSFKKIYHNKGIFKLIIYSFIVLSVSGTIEEYQQLYFNWLKISFSFYGVIIVIYMFFQALGNRLAYKFKS